METRSTYRQTPDAADLGRGIRKRSLQMLIAILIQAAILFAASGRLDWWLAWAYIAVFVGFVAVNSLITLRIDPELIAERAETKENTKGWDKAVTSLIAVASLAILLVAGLDVRFAWPPKLALALQGAGLAAVVLGYGVASWAMLSNRFFSRVVRIQEDRGQTVVTTGPYRLVRHPGYSGMILYYLAAAPALGSLWALVPAGLVVASLLVRTVLEDKTLQAELAGYCEYAQHVRYRLLPGIW